MTRTILSRLTAFALPALLAGVITSCDSDPTAPLPTGFVSITPTFAAQGSAEVANISRLHVIFTRLDGTVAKDTTISVSAGSVSSALILQVDMARGSETAGQDFGLVYELQDASGTTFFRGGPIDVHASADLSPSSTEIPAIYVGPGATAIRIELAPATQMVNVGGNVDFTATAFNASNAVVPNAIVVWSTENSAVATFPDPSVGHAVAGTARGTTTVRARLITGQTAEGTLIVQPPAAAIAAQSGNNQTVSVGTAATQQLVVRVTGADGIGVTGIPVSFDVQSGTGTIGAATVTSDADGLARVTYTAPGTPGSEVVRATVSGLAGSPVVFNLTVVPGAPSQLVFLTQPTSGIAGNNIAPPVRVEARDAFGNPATNFAGVVTLSLEGNPALILTGSPSVTAVGGIATFSGVRVSGAGTALTLRASSAGVPGTAVSVPFSMTAAVASTLTVVTAPTFGTIGQTLTIVAEARTATGELAVEHQGGAVVTILSGPLGATMVGVGNQALFVNGVVTLNFGLSHEGNYELLLTASGLQQKIIGPLSVGTAQMVIVSGNNQVGTAGGALPSPLVVRVTNGDGVAAAGVPVNWSTSGGGALNPPTSSTDVNGNASAVWFLGPSGGQNATASVGGLFVTFVANALSPTPQLVVIPKVLISSALTIR